MLIVPALSSNNLPPAYTELEYIQSTGKQYIDTSVTFTKNIQIEVKFLRSNNNSLYGAYTFDLNATSAMTFAYLSVNADNRFIYDIDKTNIHIIKQDKEKLYLDGTLINTFSASGNPKETMNILINARREGNNIYDFGTHKFYYVKIWDNDTIVRNLVPARRNSDYIVGMYDTVSNTFFTNAGTGSFIAGPVLEIEIATTKYVETAFAPTVTELNTAIDTVKTVVDNTIIQADRIDKLHTGKQNRPDEQCPLGRECLLITEADGSLHWYPICDANGSVEPIDINAILTQLTGTGDSYYYHGNTTTLNELGYTGSARTQQPSTDSIVRQLNETEWAVLWNGKGVIYGTSVCNNNTGRSYDMNNPTTSISQTETKGASGWCKMISVAGTDGIEHTVSGTTWVFYGTGAGSYDCASNYASACTYAFSKNASFRSAIVSVDN